jgi:hypothetical protein
LFVTSDREVVVMTIERLEELREACELALGQPVEIMPNELLELIAIVEGRKCIRPTEDEWANEDWNP